MSFATAPGKIILFGEHAVVYGQPAIAVPLAAVQATAHVEAAPPGSGLTVRAPDLDRAVVVPEETVSAGNALANALVYPLQLARAALDVPLPDATITIQSTIPMASGLGSGAAVATALIRAFAAAVERPLDLEQLNRLVYAVEERHHGTPSGIDNTVIVYAQPVYFVRGQPLETFYMVAPFTLLVGDTGQGSPTKIAVGDVRQLYDADPKRITPILESIGALVRDARAAIEAGTIEALGPLMDANHDLLRALTVSNAALDALCEAARAAGAWGAKLSGGGRGGNMIALVAPERADTVAAALEQAGAVRVICTTVGV